MGILDAPIVDASSSKKGKIQLAGDLAGTAASPTVASRVATKTVAPTGTPADYNTTGTNDDVVIQAAINAVNTAGGGTVLLRAGTYSISASITFYNNLHIRGEGMGSTILKMANGANLGSIFSGNTRSYVTFQDFQLDGNKANQTGPNICSLISSSLSSHITCVNLYIHDSVRQGIYLGGATDCTWINCRAINNGKDIGIGSPTLQGFGFGINDSGSTLPSGNRFIGCYTSGNAEGGFTIFGSDTVHRPLNNSVVGCITNNDPIGVSLWLASSTTVSGCSFSNCSGNALGNGGYGLQIHGAIGNSIIGNTINTTTSHGIYSNTSAFRNTISGNTVRNAGANGIVADTSEGCTISSNNCIASHNAGILVKDNGLNGVSNNQCYRNGGDGIRLQHSSSNIVNGNKCYNNSQTTIGANYGINIDSLSGGTSAGSTRNIVTSNWGTDTQATSISASLTADALSGQAVILVADTSVFWPNQFVTIQDGNGSENNTIASIDSTSQITMNTNLANTYTVAASALVKGRSTQRYGIFEQNSNCDFNQINSNVCRNNANGQIVTAGINTQVAHNLTS